VRCGLVEEGHLVDVIEAAPRERKANRQTISQSLTAKRNGRVFIGTPRARCALRFMSPTQSRKQLMIGDRREGVASPRLPTRDTTSLLVVCCSNRISNAGYLEPTSRRSCGGLSPYFAQGAYRIWPDGSDHSSHRAVSWIYGRCGLREYSSLRVAMAFRSRSSSSHVANRRSLLLLSARSLCAFRASILVSSRF
jgi:hypothetical protein